MTQKYILSILFNHKSKIKSMDQHSTTISCQCGNTERLVEDLSKNGYDVVDTYSSNVKGLDIILLDDPK